MLINLISAIKRCEIAIIKEFLIVIPTKPYILLKQIIRQIEWQKLENIPFARHVHLNGLVFLKAEMNAKSNSEHLGEI